MKARTWVETVGVGRRSAEPDGLELLLELSCREAKVADALSRLSAATGRLATVFESQGIPASDRLTRALNVDPWHGRSGELLGHLARRATLVRLRELDQVGRLLIAAGDLGDGLQISQLHWTSSRAPEYRVEARQLAVRDALARASQMAGAAGLVPGQVVRLEELQDSGGFTVHRGQRFLAASAGPARLELEPGELEYTVQVRLRCRLRQADSGAPGRRRRRGPAPPGRR